MMLSFLACSGGESQEDTTAIYPGGEGGVAGKGGTAGVGGKGGKGGSTGVGGEGGSTGVGGKGGSAEVGGEGGSAGVGGEGGSAEVGGEGGSAGVGGEGGSTGVGGKGGSAEVGGEGGSTGVGGEGGSTGVGGEGGSAGVGGEGGSTGVGGAGQGGAGGTAGKGGTGGAGQGGAGGTAGKGGVGGAGGVDTGPCPVPEVPVGALSVKDLGAKGDGISDDTKAIQTAVDTVGEGGTVYVPNGKYLIKACKGPNGIKLKSNMTLLLSKGAVLQAIPNDCGSYTIVGITGQHDVVVAGGTVIGDRDDHIILDPNKKGESGMGIAVRNSNRVDIRGVTIKDTWGDGIYIGGSAGEESTDVGICQVVVDHVRRNGMAIVNADKVVVKYSTFMKTEGTPPHAGVDLEPNGGCKVTNITFDHVQFSENGEYGLNMNRHENTLSNVVVKDCDFNGNGNQGIRINRAEKVVLKDSIFDKNIIGTDIAESTSGVEISGNTYIDNTWLAVMLRETSTGNTVKNNICTNEKKTHISCQKDKGCTKNMVSNNTGCNHN